MKYKKPHIVQIKPGIVVELTTAEAIILLQELFRVVYGETPVPSSPPIPVNCIGKTVDEVISECPAKPFEIWCSDKMTDKRLCSSFGKNNETH